MYINGVIVRVSYDRPCLWGVTLDLEYAGLRMHSGAYVTLKHRQWQAR